MSPECLHRDDVSEVWHGDCLDAAHVGAVMCERIANAVIFDAPYSEKTHEGHKRGKLTADRAAAFAARHADSPTPESAYAARHYATASGASAPRRDIEYSSWTADEIDVFMMIWGSRARGWFVSITDDPLAPDWADAYRDAGLYPFAPLPLVETGARVRMTGDGPSNWTCWICVARPKTREFASWGTLPGAYVQPAERTFNSSSGAERIVGGKPERSMRAIVRDYSRVGDLVVDPTAGAGTTLIAAKKEGRRSIGIEKDRERAELCARRVAAVRFTPSLFEQRNVPEMQPQELFR